MTAALAAVLQRWTRIGGLAVAVVLGAGCSQSAPHGEVRGQVAIGGQPAAEILVLFRGASNGATSRAAGVTDAQGRFHLRQDDGSATLTTGEYLVSFEDLRLYENSRSDDADTGARRADRIAERYRLSSAALPRFTVVSGAQAADFSLETATP